MARYETTETRVVEALLLGPFAAVIALYLFVVIERILQSGDLEFTGSFWIIGVPIAMIYLAVLIGVIVIGGPIWMCLHRWNKTHWGFGILVGFLAPFIFVLFWMTEGFTGTSTTTTISTIGGQLHWNDGQLTTAGLKWALKVSAIFGLFGSIVGLTIWRISYRRIG